MANETAGGDIVEAMWTGLVDYDPLTALPRLANAHDINTADNKNWTIRLNRGWKFHDGTPVTAQSYVKAWNWAAQCGNRATNQAFFGPAGANIAGYEKVAGTPDANGDVKCPDKELPMSGLKVVNDSTFTIELESPVSILESILGYWAFSPMPNSFFKNPDGFTKKPVGNGPFKFTNRTIGENVLMSANADYLGTDKAQVEKLDWRVYVDLEVAYADLIGGKLDFLTKMPTSALVGKRWQTELGEGRYLLKPAGLFTSLTFPMYDPRFTNPSLRAAISRAVDRVSIVRDVWSDTVTPADSWAPAVVEGYVPGACGVNCVYDPTAAKELLSAAGGFTGELSVAFNVDGGHADWVAGVCQSITNTLGIVCTPKPFPSQKEFLAAVASKGMVGLFRTTWRMDYPNVQNFLEPLYSTGGANEGGFSDPQFDELMKQAKALPPPEALAKYTEAQTILATQMPAIPLWFGTVQMGWSSRIDTSKLLISPFATVDLGTIAISETTPQPVPQQQFSPSPQPSQSAASTPTDPSLPAETPAPVDSIPPPTPTLSVPVATSP